MTTLMKTLIERLQELLGDEPDKYAATYLKELEEDQRWEKLFDQTTEEQWTTQIEPFRIMIASDLDLSSDYSETYGKHRHGDKKHRG